MIKDKTKLKKNKKQKTYLTYKYEYVYFTKRSQTDGNNTLSNE